MATQGKSSTSSSKAVATKTESSKGSSNKPTMPKTKSSKSYSEAVATSTELSTSSSNEPLTPDAFKVLVETPKVAKTAELEETTVVEHGVKVLEETPKFPQDRRAGHPDLCSVRGAWPQLHPLVPCGLRGCCQGG